MGSQVPRARSTRVEVKPELLRWARRRSGLDSDLLFRRFRRLADWEREEARPTLKQLERFANATRTPLRHFFLPEPPLERVPIPDLRTGGNRRIEHPSPDLLDTLDICQQRQQWYGDFVRSQGDAPVRFVGSATLVSDIEATATAIRRTLGFEIEERRKMPTWTEALRRLIEQAEALGVLVMINGVVGNNNYRRLDPDEFRGIALADNFAPLVFINGADAKAAQIFTLAHELAHISLGSSALSDVGPVVTPAHEVERWCSEVAAELLLPLASLRAEYQRDEELRGALDRLSRRFKVSTLVILRRIHDAGGFTRDRFRQAYQQELQRLRAIPRGSGGNFYRTQAARVGKRFARALVISALEGQTPHRDAFRLLGVSKLATLREFGNRLGVLDRIPA
jgi:Zn-dependent peptidase ImmA (M78 family)/transcriptional regulator with XRE-family HTH domain